ncbi:MAG TPA: pyruvate dehydrogenase [Planctomycetaceae bacterium]|nr:pyruvate dehydrogenase [Planctomycetaceae bacterium]
MANAVQVKLPEIGDGIDSGDIIDVFVSVGDVIKEGQDIVEIETDKATVAVPSTSAGKVTKILVKTGDSVPVGGPLLEVEAADGGSAASEKPAAEAPKAEEKKPVAEPVAEEPKPAPTPAAPAPVAEAKPAAVVPSAPATPPAPAVSSAPKPVPGPVSPPPVREGDDEIIPAGPAIRRLAREVGVALSQVTGTGDGGRITREDVLAVVRQTSQAVRSVASQASAALAAAMPSLPGSPAAPAEGSGARDDHGPIRVQRMTKIRKTIAAKMHASWSTVPRVTNFDDADVTDLERLRQSSKDDYAAQGLKLTTMPFLIKAVATALRHHADINAVIDSENEQIICKDYVNIGIAVDTENGLVVPVLKDVDKMGIPEITRKLAEMAGKVRSGQFAVNELRGGTFTISNLGAIGGQYSTPIVNVPEVAILLVGRSRKLPVVMPDDSIQARLMMPLSLSYDHRLVDGGAAARFLNDIIGYLEAPSRLLLAL